MLHANPQGALCERSVAAFGRKPHSSFPKVCGALPRRCYCGWVVLQRSRKELREAFSFLARLVAAELPGKHGPLTRALFGNWYQRLAREPGALVARGRMVVFP